MANNTSEIAGYETNTVDPGLEFMVAVVALCVLINLSLPLWLRLGSWWNRLAFTQVDSLEHEEVEIHFSPSKLEEAAAKLNVRSGSLFSNNKLNSNIKHMPPPSAGSNVDAPTSVNVKSLMEEYDDDRSKNDNNAPSSIVSSSVGSSSLVSDVPSSLLCILRKRSRLPISHCNMNIRSHVKGSESPRRVVVSKATAFTTTEQAFNRDTAIHGDLINVFHDHNIFPHVGRDDRSDPPPSVMSKLDLDEISFQDAVDAKDYCFSPTVLIEASVQNSSFGFAKLLEIADWDKEMKKYVSLAVPICTQAMSCELFAIVNVAIVGYKIGAKEANAFVLVGVLVKFTSTVTRGFAECK
jgi:hypothetical protein